jgi:hypothetical protein
VCAGVDEGVGVPVGVDDDAGDVVVVLPHPVINATAAHPAIPYPIRAFTADGGTPGGGK